MPTTPLKSKNFFSSGAGLSSTVQDYAKFLNLFLNNGNSNGRQIIGNDSTSQKFRELVFQEVIK